MPSPTRFKTSLVQFAFNHSLNQIGGVDRGGSNAYLQFFDADTYPVAGRKTNTDVVVWPNRIEVLEYSSDPRERPCTARRFDSLREFLQDRTNKEIERRASKWAMAQAFRPDDKGLADLAALARLKQATNDSKAVSTALTQKMNRFFKRSLAIRYARWVTGL